MQMVAIDGSGNARAVVEVDGEIVDLETGAPVDLAAVVLRGVGPRRRLRIAAA